MAQYLLLEFDNDAQCQALVAKVDATGGTSFRVRGIFQKATKFCDCLVSEFDRSHDHTARGEKFGWWVHRACRRAMRAPQTPRNLRESHTHLHLHDGENPTPNFPITVKR